MDVNVQGNHNQVVMGDCYQITVTSDAMQALAELIKWLWIQENKE